MCSQRGGLRKKASVMSRLEGHLEGQPTFNGLGWSAPVCINLREIAQASSRGNLAVRPTFTRGAGVSEGLTP